MLAEWITQHGITAKVGAVDTRPDSLMADLPRHFRVTLKRGTKRMTVYFSQGAAHTKAPTVGDVLECLASDQTDESFDDWCSNYGLDTDSRSAERTYKAVTRSSKALARFLGADLLADLTYSNLES